MSTVYKMVAKDGRDWCFVFCSEVPHNPGIFAASVVYWRRTETSSAMVMEHFSSAKDMEDAQRQAEDWIKKNLFESYQRHSMMERA